MTDMTINYDILSEIPFSFEMELDAIKHSFTHTLLAGEKWNPFFIFHSDKERLLAVESPKVSGETEVLIATTEVLHYYSCCKYSTYVIAVYDLLVDGQDTICCYLLSFNKAFRFTSSYRIDDKSIEWFDQNLQEIDITTSDFDRSLLNVLYVYLHSDLTNHVYPSDTLSYLSMKGYGIEVFSDKVHPYLSINSH